MSMFSKSTFGRVRVALAALLLAAAGLVLASTSAQAATPSCGNHSLSITASQEDGATGHATFVIRYKNITEHTCTIFGYPGLDARSLHNHTLAHAHRTLSGFTGGAHHERTVTLHPGGHASARVEWHLFNFTTSGSCPFSHDVATTAANTSHTVHLARSVSECGLQVHPTVSGWSGNN